MAVVVHLRLFIVEAQAGRQFKPLPLVAQLEESRRTVCRDYEIVINGETVVTERKISVTRQQMIPVVVCILENEIVDSILFEGDRSLHIKMLVEAVQTTHPAERTVAFRTHHEFLCHRTFALVLSHREILQRQKVIVYAHPVTHELQTRCRGKGESVKKSFCHKAVGHIETAIAARIVIGHRSEHPTGILPVCPTAFVGITEGKRVVEAP